MALSPINAFLPAIDIQQNSISPFSNLPQDIQKLVFLFLSLEDLVRSSQVSRTWKILSDSDSRWATFLKRMGLVPQANSSSRADYGCAQTAINNNRYKFQSFPSWCESAIRHGENLFLNYREGIQVFNFRTQKQFILNERAEVFRGCVGRIEIVSDYLMETIFSEPALIFNLYSTRSFKCLFSWKQTLNSEHFFNSRMSVKNLVFHYANKLVHAVDETEDGQPGIYIRNTEKECLIEATFSHPNPVIFFQVHKDQIISIDTESKLRVWDILDRKCVRTISLTLPAKIEIENVNLTVVNENGIFVLGRTAAFRAATFKLNEILIGNDGELYLTFSYEDTRSIASFNREGQFKEFFEGEVALISKAGNFRVIRTNLIESSIGSLAPLNVSSIDHFGCVWFVTPDAELLTSSYDLRDGALLDRGILDFFEIGDKVVYLKEDGVIYERDIYSTEITRRYVRGISHQVDRRTICLNESQSPPSWSGFERNLFENGINIHVKETQVTVSFTDPNREKLVLQVNNPIEDIQLFEGNVGILAIDRTLYLLNETEMVSHPNLVSKIATYSYQLIGDAGNELHIFEGLSTSRVHIQENEDLLFYTFNNGRFIGVRDSKLEVWDLAAETYYSIERRLNFPIYELVVKNNKLYEIVEDLEGSNYAIIIWDLLHQNQITILPNIKEYKILDTVIVTWGSFETLCLWNLRGQHLREISTPGHDPLEHYFYFFGNASVSFLGSEGRTLSTLEGGQPFYLEFPDLQLSKEREDLPDSNPKKRKERVDDLFNLFESERN